MRNNKIFEHIVSEPEKFQKPGAGYTTLVAWMCLSESGIFAIKELSRNTLLHCKKRELNPVYCDLERRCAPLKSALFPARGFKRSAGRRTRWTQSWWRAGTASRPSGKERTAEWNIRHRVIQFLAAELVCFSVGSGDGSRCKMLSLWTVKEH